jgi:cytochrome c-type biogenesis protein
MNNQDITLIYAFVAGFLSFFTPCVFPLIPSYIAFITGISFKDLSDDQKEKRKEIIKITMINSLSFIIGFSFVFISLGAISTFIGSFLKSNQRLIEIIGGVIIILLGIHIMGIIKIRQLYSEKRIHLANKPKGILGSIIVGIVFAAGWTPCIGPILGSILIVASQNETILQGVFLLTAYSLGLAIPFFLASVLFTSFLTLSTKVKKYLHIIEIISGILLIVIGILLVSGLFNKITRGLTGTII